MKKIHLLIVDDHPLARFGIRNQLKDVEDFSVVGEAEDGPTALKMVKEFHPDVIILDLFIPAISGFEVTKTVRAEHPGTHVLILTAYEQEEYVHQALEFGAEGYLLKSAEKQDLIDAVRNIMKGEKTFSPRIKELIVRGFLNRREQPKTSAPPASLLTARELEILELVSQGYTNQQIAQKLFISSRTIDTHRTNIMHKIGVHDVAHLVRYAIEHGLVKDKG
ncbi:MAG TPA: response regulator transcription factor [Bacteroidota bacterium]|nr:response regulator transcription factor [Bacteroidota bacterium]